MTPPQRCPQHAHPGQAGCVGCQRAKRFYGNWYRAQRNHGVRRSVPADLTRTRLQELRAAGYPVGWIAEQTGLTGVHVQRLTKPFPSARTGGGVTVTLGTFQAVDRVYRDWRDYPGPNDRARVAARARGWRPPLLLVPPPTVDEHTVDEVAVRRAVNGERVPLTRAEIVEAWRRLEAAGLSANQIGERLHTTARTVQRWRDDGPATRERAG